MGASLPPGRHAAAQVCPEPLPSALPSWARAFPGVPQQASAARRFVAGLLEGSPFRDDAVVVLSELFTNAVLHTGSGKPGGLVVVQVSRWRLGVRIAVTDQGSHSQPVIRAPGTSGELAEDGNGLYLADHLADRLDWHDDASGRTICAVLGQLPPHPPHRPAQPAQCPRLPQHA
ncbi:MAG: ATP-binding protein [Streptosporangiaceae bacterium]